MRSILLALLGMILLSSGCKLTPDYERPDLDPPKEWLRTSDTRDSIANLAWWEIYEDPTLSSLIETALENNQDLAIALARLQEFDYLITFTRADQFPFLDIFGGAGRGRQSREINPSANTDNNFSIGANLSFEVDLWRKYSRATEAARADFLATEHAYRNVTISLIASVANGYLLLLDLDNQLAISKRTAEGRRNRLEIVRARFEKGTEAELDVNQAEVQLAIAEAAVAQFSGLVPQAEHALRVLLGQFPGPIPRGKQLGVDEWPMDIPAGLPSELLERRPDIVEAEQRLAAETARIGVAQAMRFPALSLTANVSAVAESLTDLNSTDAGEWNIIAGIFQPIFNAGQLKAQMKAQVARTEQARHAYIGVLQNAFREVEDSLVAVEYLRDEREARRRQVAAAASAARLSQARYDGGVVDYLEVIDSERSLFDAELAESAVRRRALGAFVNLYKALGGGWTVEEDPVEGEESEEEPEVRDDAPMDRDDSETAAIDDPTEHTESEKDS